LQIMIWQFALLNPQVIKLICKGRKNSKVLGRIVPADRHPLLLTTMKSREVALVGLRDSMISVSNYSTLEAFQTGIATYRHSVPFRPTQDTLPLSNRWVLYHLEEPCSPEITAEPISADELSSVKYLAIGGFQMPTTIWERNWPWGVERNERPLDQEILSIIMFTTRFTGLEDLILIRGGFLSWRLVQRSAHRLAGRWATGRRVVRYSARVAGCVVDRLVSKNRGLSVRHQFCVLGRASNTKCDHQGVQEFV
jgi:hypothetical protein